MADTYSIKTAQQKLSALELLADPNAMSAIRKHREGSATYHDVAALDEVSNR